MSRITEFGVNQIFHDTCEAVKRVIPYHRMGLSLYAPGTGALKLVAAIGCAPDSYYHVGLSLDCKGTHHGWFFQHKKPILRRDLQREVEFQIEQHNLTEGFDPTARFH
ncbi:MAG: hypothetical protein ACM3WP_12485 [Acidobacteriota bacterium]